MFSKLFTSLFSKDVALERATDLYSDIVLQARTPYFYSDLDVPDTVEGRFDMITLHMFLVLRRLKESRSQDVQKFPQKLFDVMFTNMDHSLRELGVGDLSVGKKVRGLAEAFYGRVGVYEAALGSNDADGLSGALNRNIYGHNGRSTCSDRLAAYVIKTDNSFKDQSIERLILGIVCFLDVNPANTDYDARSV